MTNPTRTPRRLTPVLRVGALAVLLALGLGACSKKGEGAASGQATQVAAKVGDSEISVHQINQVLSRAPVRDPSKEGVQAASKQVLERLIDQQLAVDAATADNLHRSPEVIAALEAARRDVLARAYVQKIAGSVAKATPEEISQYYRDHPALFSERRVFNLQELRLADPGAALADVRKLTDQGKPVEEIVAFLKEKSLSFTGGNATRAAEQLPLDLLPKLHALKDGDYLIAQNGKAATVIRVAGSQQAPITEEKARPAIEQFLNNRRIGEAVAAEMKRMRGATTITYMGDFNAPATAAATETTPSVTQPAPAENPATPATADQATLQRGIQGLK